MTDRELLEIAAKAACVHLGSDRIDCAVNVGGVSWPKWNPLTDDGDALRLAVKLGIEVQHSAGAAWVQLVGGQGRLDLHNEPYGSDACAATRRAIVRAAAEIGRTL